VIKQRTPTDCGVASLANALSITYEQALDCFGPCADLRGTTAADTCNALLQLGVTPSYATFPAFYLHLGTTGNPCSPDVVRSCPAILTILSRSGHGLHAVYWDGHQAHDPDPKFPNPRALEDLVILEAVFVSKNGLCANREAGLRA
jgi:hypothetical protein